MRTEGQTPWLPGNTREKQTQENTAVVIVFTRAIEGSSKKKKKKAQSVWRSVCMRVRVLRVKQREVVVCIESASRQIQWSNPSTPAPAPAPPLTNLLCNLHRRFSVTNYGKQATI